MQSAAVGKKRGVDLFRAQRSIPAIEECAVGLELLSESVESKGERIRAIEECAVGLKLLSESVVSKEKRSPSEECGNADCPLAVGSLPMHRINSTLTKAGGQDWSSLHNSLLCNACYRQFMSTGSLHRSVSASLAPAAQRCTYSRCPVPLGKKVPAGRKVAQFAQIKAECTAGIPQSRWVSPGITSPEIQPSPGEKHSGGPGSPGSW
jgi:hypothetical protein